MLYHIPKFIKSFECFAIWENGFSEDELEKILFLENLQSFEKGKVGTQSVKTLDTVRDSDISWIIPDNNSEWLFSRLSSIISTINYDHFMYHISGIESIQYTKYKHDQHYNWHWDDSFEWRPYVRKISMVMMLTDPEEYEGGELEVCNTGNFENTQKLKPKRGDIVFFSSWMPHKVHPVISGERKTLVTWIMGNRE